MNKQGRLVVEVMLMLVVILVTSIVILLMVQTGVLSVQAASEDVSLLNAEFLPIGREGTLAVKGFKFCSFVDKDFSCEGEARKFSAGNRIYFRFLVESSAVQGEVKLVENYRLIKPDGKVSLEAEDKYNNYLNKESSLKSDAIPFKDYILFEEDSNIGTYVLELIIENPLLNKQVVLIEEVEIINE